MKKETLVKRSENKSRVIRWENHADQQQLDIRSSIEERASKENIPPSEMEEIMIEKGNIRPY